MKPDHARLRPSIFRLLPLHLESESFWGDERGVCLEEELVVETCDTCDEQEEKKNRFDDAPCKITGTKSGHSLQT